MTFPTFMSSERTFLANSSSTTVTTIQQMNLTFPISPFYTSIKCIDNLFDIYIECAVVVPNLKRKVNVLFFQLFSGKYCVQISLEMHTFSIKLLTFEQ